MLHLFDVISFKHAYKCYIKLYDKTSKNNITDIYLFLILLKNLQSGILTLPKVKRLSHFTFD